MSYQKNELLNLVKKLTDEIVSKCYAYEEDLALFRHALTFQPGDMVEMQSGTTCPCCKGLTMRVLRVYVDEYESPAIEAEFVGNVDRSLRECGKGDSDLCICAPDHLVKKVDSEQP
jgi:hypothetical protein